jgi:hypothetical protein
VRTETSVMRATSLTWNVRSRFMDTTMGSHAA